MMLVYESVGLFLSQPCHFLTLKGKEFIAGQWYSGQLVPAGVTVTTRARNVTAGHPTQLTTGGMCPMCMHTHEHADTLHEVSQHSFHMHAHILWDYKHATRNNLLHSLLLADHLISFGLEVPKTEELVSCSKYLPQTYSLQP